MDKAGEISEKGSILLAAASLTTSTMTACQLDNFSNFSPILATHTEEMAGKGEGGTGRTGCRMVLIH